MRSFILFLLILLSHSIFASDKYRVIADQTYVRDGAGESFQIIDTLKSGKRIKIDSINSGWGRIVKSGKIKGWVLMAHLMNKKDQQKSTNDSNSKEQQGAKDTSKQINKQEVNNNSASSRQQKSDDKPSDYKGLLIILGIIILTIFLSRKKKGKSNSYTSKTNTQLKNQEYKPVPKQQPTNCYCEYCGFRADKISVLTAMSCSNHPLGYNKGKHSLYLGKEKSKYYCKWCGIPNNSILSLTKNSCRNHPNGYHKGKCSPAL